MGARFENSPAEHGVVVGDLSPSSPAAQSGLRPGDLIVAANRRRVQNVDALVRAVQRNRREILLQVEWGGDSFYLVVR